MICTAIEDVAHAIGQEDTLPRKVSQFLFLHTLGSLQDSSPKEISEICPFGYHRMALC